MIGHYFKIITRNIRQHKLYFAVNVLGLGIALASAIIAYLNFKYDQQFDAMHENTSDVYRVASIRENVDRVFGVVPYPFGESAVQDFANVTEALIINSDYTTIKYKSQVFNERIHFTSTNLFDFFTFPIRYGNADALNHPDQIILDEKTAQKYFGDRNPVGEVLTVYAGESNQKEMIVGAVVEAIPLNSSFKFTVLAHPENNLVKGQALDMTKWEYFADATFIRVQGNNSIANIAQQFEKYLPHQQTVRPNFKLVGFRLDPLHRAAHLSREYRANYLQSSFPASAVWGPVIMGILLLITSCLNFANTAISLSSKRLKEMGVRKVMGGTRSQLIVQLLTESFLISFFALIAGMVFTDWLLPIYNAMWPYLHLEANYLQNPQLLFYLFGILMLSTLLAGAYPAFYISAFNPSNIFRGSVKFGGNNLFSRFLLGIQISISLVAVICGLTFVKNAVYQENVDMGYNRHEMIIVPVVGKANYETLRNSIQQNPLIESVAGTHHHVGYRYQSVNIKSQEQEREVSLFQVGKSYLDQMEFQLADGRLLDMDLETDRDAVIINEKLQKELQWTNPIGRELSIDTARYQVVGVLKDFIQDNLFTPIDPVLIALTKEEDYQYTVVKTKEENLLTTNEYLKTTWADLFPFKPYTGFFQNEVIAEGLMVSNNIKNIFMFTALVSLLLVISGLFALLTLTIQKRQKEIAIRKVLGASLSSISYLIHKHYLIILLVAIVIGSWSGSFFSSQMINDIFEVALPFEHNISIFSSSILLMVALLTIVAKVYEIGQTNPAEVLKKD